MPVKTTCVTEFEYYFACTRDEGRGEEADQRRSWEFHHHCHIDRSKEI